MYCMKCGREVPGEQVFCEECTLEMEKYPVRPGTLVHLPRRQEPSVFRKAPKRRAPSPEEQAKGMRKLIRVLLIALLVCLVVIGLMAYPTMEYLSGSRFQIGQNYSVVTTPTATAQGD